MKELKFLFVVGVVLLITSCNEKPLPIFNCTPAFVVNKIETDGDLAVYTCYDQKVGANGSDGINGLPLPAFVAPVGTYDIGDTVYVGLPHIVYVHDTIYIKN